MSVGPTEARGVVGNVLFLLDLSNNHEPERGRAVRTSTLWPVAADCESALRFIRRPA